MTPETFIRVGLDPALSLLPARMDSPEARAMIMAICLQESRLKYRQQIGGPARGFPQFERAGVHGVLTHPASAQHARAVCGALEYLPEVDAVHSAIRDSDVLAAAMSRLLLWTLPRPLPEREDVDGSYSQYLQAWRPGKPHRSTWDALHTQAWEAVG